MSRWQFEAITAVYLNTYDIMPLNMTRRPEDLSKNQPDNRDITRRQFITLKRDQSVRPEKSSGNPFTKQIPDANQQTNIFKEELQKLQERENRSKSPRFSDIIGVAAGIALMASKERHQQSIPDSPGFSGKISSH